MSLFAALQKSWTVRREDPERSGWVNGVWTGVVDPVTVRGILRRMSPREIRALPNGQQTDGVGWVFYSTSPLTIAEQAGLKSDRIILSGVEAEEDLEAGELEVVAKERCRTLYSRKFWKHLLKRVVPPMGGEYADPTPPVPPSS
jgi:hypothetical protein